jgi:NAD(P)-dependent dehydrogenase (short-subunit alcohol dehydrogenase family)
MRFDGRVAIVTGAGGNPGVGRAHARLLAARGAKVVVNDFGVGAAPDGSKPANAEAVAAEITAAGGEAIADLHSVASEESARAVVQTALDAWGRVDILINNAGVGVVAGFEEITSTDIERVVGVHLMGGIWMCRAAWPRMIDAGYGRIVNTCSGGMYGMDGLTVYGAAKFGMYGLTRGLATEGAAHGIRVNAFSPGAFTNSVDPFYEIPDPAVKQAFIDAQPAELVSPGVAYLAHEDCRVSGMLFDISGGSMTATFLAASPGYASRELTIEDVRDHLDEILDQSQFNVITDPTNPTRIAEAAAVLVRKPYVPAPPEVAAIV